MNPLGIELLTVLGMGPVEHVRLAGDLGCTAVSMGLTQLPFNPHGYPAWSLQDDPALRRELTAAMRDCGVSIAIGEGIGVRPDGNASDRAAELDLFAELGAQRINSVDMGEEKARAFDELARLSEMARERGMAFSVEFCPVFTIASLPAALEVVDHIGRDACTVLIDSMHFFRSGGTIEELEALDPALIGHVQLCDAPLTASGDYMQEAMFGRMIPGEGGLPLRDFVAALPGGTTLGLEVPRLAEAEGGRAASDYVGEIVTKTRKALS